MAKDLGMRAVRGNHDDAGEAIVTATGILVFTTSAELATQKQAGGSGTALPSRLS